MQVQQGFQVHNDSAVTIRTKEQARKQKVKAHVDSPTYSCAQARHWCHTARDEYRHANLKQGFHTQQVQRDLVRWKQLATSEYCESLNSTTLIDTSHNAHCYIPQYKTQTPSTAILTLNNLALEYFKATNESKTFIPRKSR